MAPRYSLIDEPWIPVVRPGGHLEQVSLRVALLEANRVVEIQDASPLVIASLVRFLICLAHRIERGPSSPEQWLEIWNRGHFSAEPVTAYLARWAPRFDLFDAKFPFFQVAGFTTLNGGKPAEPKPLSAIAHELASANNTTLFDHSLDSEPACHAPDWCARQLITFQAWALGGGQGPTSNLGKHPYARHAPLGSKLQVFIKRANLFETLVANMLVIEPGEDFGEAEDGGRPIWERDEIRPVIESPTRPEGLCDYLSFPARYVRLLPEQHQDATMVRHAYVAQGLFTGDQRDPYNPLVVTDEKVFPLGLDPDKEPWRDAHALFSWTLATNRDRRHDNRPRNLRQANTSDIYHALGGDSIITIEVFGLASDRAQPLSWCARQLPLEARILTSESLAAELRATIERINEGGICLRTSIERMVKTVLETPQKKADPALVNQMTARLMRGSGFWATVEPGFAEYMRTVAADPVAAQTGWLRMMRRAADEALARATRSLPGRDSARLRAEASARGWLHTGLARIARTEASA